MHFTLLKLDRLGSSPLARGTLLDTGTRYVLPGLIPARAGNTHGRLEYGAYRRAHPRSRGEHVRRISSARVCLGSSPLARGTPGMPRCQSPRRGLIPARAGNTSIYVIYAGSLWAHPRSRGEHQPLTVYVYTRPGSSPLARGTPPPRVMGGASNGLIPARAGNTSRRTAHRASGWAHPRSRGEHFISTK